MSEDEPVQCRKNENLTSDATLPKISVSLKLRIFFRRLFGYGILFLIILVSFATTLEHYSIVKTPLTRWDEQAEHFDLFTLTTPDPVKFWSWRVEAPELFPIQSDRFNTLMVQQDYNGYEWICAGLKDQKTVVYYMHSYTMRQIAANDHKVYCPADFFGKRRWDNSLEVSSIIKNGMDRLSESLGEQGIRDLLLIGKEFRKIRDTHYSRELLFDSILMATAWSKRHPDSKIDIADIPSTATYPLTLK